MSWFARYAVAVAGALASSFAAVAVNSVSITGVRGLPGTTASVTVSLSNDVPVGGMQLMLHLPQGTEVVRGSGASAGRAAGMDIHEGSRDGVANVSLFSLSGQTVAVGSGSVASFSLRLGDSPVVENIGVDVILSDPSGKELEASSEGFRLIVDGASYSLDGREYTMSRLALGQSGTIGVMVRSTGSQRLDISGVSSPDAGWSLDAPVSIAPGEIREARLRYSPSVRGSLDSRVSFVSNAAGDTPAMIFHTEGYAVNTVRLADVAGNAGDEVEVGVTVDNYDPLPGFTLAIRLPEGLEYVADSAELSPVRSDGHIMTERVESASAGDTSSGNGADRILTLTACSLSNRPFIGKSGVVATFRVRIACRSDRKMEIAQAVLPAVLDGRIENVASGADGAVVRVYSPVVTAPESVDFGHTSVTEQALGRVKIGNSGSRPLVVTALEDPDGFVEVLTALPLTVAAGKSAVVELACDRKDDGMFSGCVNVHSNDPETPVVPVGVKISRYSPNELGCGEVTGLVGSQATMNVSLSNYDEVLGMQFDLSYPGNCFTDVSVMPAGRAAQFTVAVKRMSADAVRVMAYTLGEGVAPGDGTVLKVVFTPADGVGAGRYRVSFSDILIGNDKLADRNSGAAEIFSAITFGKPVETVMFDRTQFSMKVGAQETILSTVLPADAMDTSLSWSSSDPGIVAVDDCGNVEGLAEGSAVITAVANDGSGASASCVVLVSGFSGIDAARASSVNVFVRDGAVLVEGIPRGSRVRICSVSGAVVYDGYDNVVKGLSPGVYVVVAEGLICKVLL